MIRSLWIARTGLDAQQTSLDVIANNLANVSTNGFKRARPVFEDLLYQTLRQPGAQSSQSTQIPSGLQLGTGVQPISTARIHTQGSLQQTGNDLDVAINGAGFLQILLPDGTTGHCSLPSTVLHRFPTLPQNGKLRLHLWDLQHSPEQQCVWHFRTSLPSSAMLFCAWHRAFLSPV